MIGDTFFRKARNEPIIKKGAASKLNAFETAPFF